MEEITIKDIARICGVGVSTVSRAINNHPDINPETKEMIMRVIKENNYVPNNSARNLKRQMPRQLQYWSKVLTTLSSARCQGIGRRDQGKILQAMYCSM